ncbi:ECF-type sigma factor [Marinicella rhabdoformis]|uniref:ECF-type sigma factor n=1 Tax=Marinicella rhabdoformis TaxID=2580566 RepID=UPI0012AEB6D5|nr:ECF-type sigma factor [Marinicella rhabdoformis]
MQAGEITKILGQKGSIDKKDLDYIYSLLYGEIKVAAHQQLAHFHNNNTISATVLAHECYLKLSQVKNLNNQDRRHLLNYLARAMRRYLIDQVRSKQRLKRKALVIEQSYSQILGSSDVSLDLFEVDRLIDLLYEIDAHLAELVQQKIIFNFTFKELSEIFGLSERQLIRQWNQAKSLLLTMIENDIEH